MQEASQARAIYGHGVFCIKPQVPFPAQRLQLNYRGHQSHNYKLLLTSKMAIQNHNTGQTNRGEMCWKQRTSHAESEIMVALKIEDISYQE